MSFRTGMAGSISRLLLLASVCFAWALLSCGCVQARQAVVVVYCAADRAIAEPLFAEFEQATGIKVEARYTGEGVSDLANLVRYESTHPKCDVLWNDDVAATIKLAKDGKLQAYALPSATAVPEQYRDPDGRWIGFAARARILLVNTNLLTARGVPATVADLANPALRGKVAMAEFKSSRGSALHAACLYSALGAEGALSLYFALASNAVIMRADEKAVADAVVKGDAACGMTDTDSALAAIRAGGPVAISYIDGEPDGNGVVFMPSTASLVARCPHPEAGRKLMEYLLSDGTERTLATSDAAYIPLKPDVYTRSAIRTPNEIKEMQVDFAKAVETGGEALLLLSDVLAPQRRLSIRPRSGKASSEQ